MTDTTNGSNTSGSLMDGIEFEKRKPVDADWSKRKRTIVGSLAGMLAMGAIGAGAYYGWQNRPVSLPTTAEQAIETIASGRVDRLSPERQTQYYGEAARLLRDVPREQWRDRFEEEDREAIGQVFRAQFDEGIREIARGNSSPQEMFRNMWGGQRPGGGRPGGDGARQRNENTENAERERRGPGSQQFASRLQSAFQNGDAQRSGLMGQFFTMMRAQRDAGGGRRGGAGGG
ncbi:MAG: hypothetical protein AAGB48_02660 [Planctomycetota bacterium]